VKFFLVSVTVQSFGMRVCSSESMPRALKREAVSELTCHDKENKGERERERERESERKRERVPNIAS